MECGSDERLALPRKWSPALFALLTGLGLAGNYFSYEIFFNLQFIFGSIGALLVLQFLGLRWGVAAAFLISLVTYKLWNHPYAIVIMTAEVLAVGLLHRRRGVSLVLADALYWLCLGIPLVILFYWGVMQLPFYSVEMTMMKQAVNGLANALVARLVFLGVESRRPRPRASLRELIFSLLVLFVLVPSFILLGVLSRADLQRTELAVHRALKFDAERTVLLVDGWLGAQLNSVAFLAGIAARQPLPMVQLSLEQMRRINPDFLRLGRLDSASLTIAFSPLVNELGKSNLGVNFADRPYIPELKRTLEPMLSEVVPGRLGRAGPIVIALAPVIKEGAYDGYLTGILDLERVRNIIELNTKAVSLPEVQFVLLDRNGKVIVSSYPGLKTHEPYHRQGGELIDCGDGICQWLPDSTRNIAVSDRWKKALYVAESRIGGKANWRLILEQPMAPYHKELFGRYARQLSIVFALLLAGLVLAEMASRLFVRSLRLAGAISTDIPDKIGAGAEIVWPTSAILETHALLENFQEMSKALADQYRTIQTLNADLEGRVAERTRQLHESEERYRNLFENNHTVMVVVDPDNGNLVDANPAAATFYGWSQEELRRKNVSEINIAAREEIFSAFKRAKSQSLEHLPFTHRLADGTLRQVEVFSGPIQSKGKTLLVSIIHDVSERRLVEQRNRDAMNYIQTLMLTSPVGIATYKATGETVSANEASARIVGTTVENMLKQNFRDLASWKQFGLLEMAERALTTGGEQRGDLSMVTSYGNKVELDCHFVPFSFGGETQLMLVALDITERRQAEGELQAKTAQLETLTKTLEQRVRDEVALRLRNEQMLVQQGKLAAMGEMLGAIAHQWRQPLNTLGLCIQNISDAYGHGELDEEYLDRTVRKSMDQVRHMSKTIDDFRDFFQPDKDRVKFDTMLAVGNVLALFSAQLKANDIVFRLTCHTHGKTFAEVGAIVSCHDKQVVGYRNEFEHVVLNLLSNAKDAILARRQDAGGVTGTGLISFEFSRDNGWVVIEVGDNGGGIPEAVLLRIFEPYFTTKEPSKGTGIGLYLSRVIIEDHMQGKLTVENRAEGAVFRITLPQTADQEAP